MKKYKLNIIQIVLIGLLSFGFLACEDFLKEYSQDLVLPKNPTDLDELLVGGADGYLPSYEIKENNEGVIGGWFNILDDDINGVVAPNAQAKWSLMSNFYFGYTTWQYEVWRDLRGYAHSDDQLWNDLYHRINAMNMILEQLKKVSTDTEKDKMIAKRVKGECHFLRAQFYFTLANIYGKAYNLNTSKTDLAVPLKLTHYVEYDKDKEVQFERATVDKVYQQVIKDLKLSIQNLTESPQKRPYFRASKEAAQLLLSRVYLYMQDWNNAYAVSNEIVKSGKELLDYRTVQSNVLLTESNPEIIFTQGSLALQNMIKGYGGGFCVSKDLYNTYSDDDLRKSIYFTKNGVTDSIALYQKYEMKVKRAKVSDAFLLRLSEAYLNGAEAAVQLGKINEAKDLMQKFCAKRYWVDVTIPIDGFDLIEFVRAERRREFCFEGHRWFDLRRYAVDVNYPFQKEIKRYFSIYDNENKLVYMNTRVYVLEKDDPAYVFQIPKSQLDYEPKQTPNKREKREYEVLEENSGG